MRACLSTGSNGARSTAPASSSPIPCCITPTSSIFANASRSGSVLVRLDAGPTSSCSCMAIARRRRASASRRISTERAGGARRVPASGHDKQADDPMLRDMTSDPKFRKVLVTDGKSAAGQAMAQDLVDAGADTVLAGVAEPWKHAGPRRSSRRRSTIVPLDVTDERSVEISPASSAARSISSSTPRNSIAPTASRGAAPRPRAPRWR